MSAMIFLQSGCAEWRQAGVRGMRVYKHLGRSLERGNISERITGASGVNLAGIVVQPF